MENVAAVSLSEQYVKKREVATEYTKFKLARVVLHELAHMWFGDLVTMTWWNDLWLKESFADFMTGMCFTESPELVNYKEISDLMFLEYENTAMGDDIKRTTHAI
jgi:aminopeptidase N